MQTTLSLLLLVGGASAFRSPATAVSPSTRLALSRSPAFARQPPAVVSSSALPVPAPAPKTPGAGRTRALFSGISVFALSLLLPALALASGSGEHLHLGQKVALYFQKFGLPDWATLALISMVPAVELRGGVPVGNWMGMSPYSTFGICILGNMAPILPTLLALRSPFVKKLAAPLLKRAEKKLAGLPTGQSRFLALALFVGIPAPGTGAWTGAIIAYLLDMPLTEAMTSIFSGVIIAGVIMTVLTLAGKAGALIALAALILAGVGAISSSMGKEGGDSTPSE